MNQAQSRRDDPDRWPAPEFDNDRQPHFLFIVTPPHAGSTVFADVLTTSDRITKLQSRGEGQWLIPGLSEKDRWDPNKHVNYYSVKAVWLNKFQCKHSRNRDISIVVEKSPPNLVRIEKLASVFNHYSIVALNRNPYAKCASTLHRTYDVKRLTPTEQTDTLCRLAMNWIELSERIKVLVRSKSLPLITYEEFCACPSAAIAKLPLSDEVSSEIDTGASVRVKDYAPQRVFSQNERQIGWLNERDVKAISDVLEPRRDILEFFGYTTLC